MKKSIIALVVGMAVNTMMVATSGAQGTVFFGNYTIGGSGLISSPVTYANANVPVGKEGLAVGPAFTAALLYSATGVAGSFADTGYTATFLGSADGDSAGGAGLFPAASVVINSYSSGAAYFQVEAYNGATWDTSTVRGISGIIQLSLLATAANQLPTGTLLSDNGSAVSPLQAFTVASPVPEPSTLALAGLGGLGMLLAFRRKKA